MKRPRLILASASPRRKELLAWAGVSFKVAPADVDESVRPGEAPEDYARRLAREKAAAAAESRPGDWILAADTVVVLEGRIMGKPADRAEASDMLGALSGRVHRVVTAFCLYNKDLGRERLEHATTEVEFRRLSVEDVERYVDSGEAWDKAGAYGIQGRGGALSARIEGSYTNVIGLPLAETLEALEEMKIHHRDSESTEKKSEVKGLKFDV